MRRGAVGWPFRCEALQHLGRGTDEREVVGADGIRESGVLGQEPVTRMDGVAAGDNRGRNDGGRREIASPRVCRSDADRLVGQLHGQAVAVGLAVGDDRRQAHGAARPEDPDGDLAAIGDQDTRNHQLPSSSGTAISPVAPGSAAAIAAAAG